MTTTKIGFVPRPDIRDRAKRNVEEWLSYADALARHIYGAPYADILGAPQSVRPELRGTTVSLTIPFQGAPLGMNLPKDDMAFKLKMRIDSMLKHAEQSGVKRKLDGIGARY